MPEVPTKRGKKVKVVRECHRRGRAELVLETGFAGKRQERTFQLDEMLWEDTEAGL